MTNSRKAYRLPEGRGNYDRLDPLSEASFVLGLKSQAPVARF